MMNKIIEKLDKEKIRRLATWFNGSKQPPFELNLFITNKCNLRCLSCLARQRPEFRPNEELSKEKYHEIIKEAGQIGIKSCSISGGGEPLCRLETTLFVMKELVNHDIIGRLITNGTLFTSEAIKELVEIGWYEVQFSIQGPNADVDNYLRGEGTFEKSVKALKLFDYWKKKLNKQLPRIIITSVVSNKNFDKIAQLATFAHDVNACAIILQPLSVSYNEIGKKLILSEEQQLQFFKYLKDGREIAEKYNLENNFRFFDQKIIEKSSEISEVIKHDSKNVPKDDLRSIPCFLPWLNLSIRADGLTGSCGGFFTENVKEKNLEAIWYSKSFEEFRKRLLDGDIPQVCSLCCGINTVNTRKIREEILNLRREGKI